MNNLELVGHVDTEPALRALVKHHDLFNQIVTRQSAQGSPHLHTRSIFLRMPPEFNVATAFESLHVIDWPALDIAEFRQLVKDVTRCVWAEELARVMLVELAPRQRVEPHADEGSYAAATERYHVPLLTNPACWMHAGKEAVYMAPGEVWYLDKHVRHWVTNDGETPRVHLILDVFA